MFVYVKDGLGDMKFPVPTTAVVLDQKGCTYAPRVFGIQAGQPLEILNSDETLHNIHALPMRQPRVQSRAGAQRTEAHARVYDGRGDGAVQV